MALPGVFVSKAIGARTCVMAPASSRSSNSFPDSSAPGRSTAGRPRKTSSFTTPPRGPSPGTRTTRCSTWRCHGEESELDLGAATVTLDALDRTLSGDCRGRVLLFATCLALGADDAALKRLVPRTVARAITGYQTEVDCLESAAFEALMLDQLLDDHRTDAFSRKHQTDHGEMTKRLGLVAATASAVYRPDTT